MVFKVGILFAVMQFMITIILTGVCHQYNFWNVAVDLLYRK